MSTFYEAFLNPRVDFTTGWAQNTAVFTHLPCSTCRIIRNGK